MPAALAVLALLSLCLVLLALVGRPLATDDTWWHLAMGETYWNEGLWPAADPLYHTTTNRPPIQHEWLFQVALHHAHGLAGFAGLRVLHVLLVAGALALAFAAFRRASRDTALAALATAVLACVSWYRLIQLRPDVVTVPAILCLCALLFARDGPPSWRRIGVATGLLVVWANAHSLFVIGLALLLAAVLGALLEALLARLLLPGASAAPALARAARLGAALALGLVATGLNPRGYAQHTLFAVESQAGSIWLIGDDFLRWHPLVPGDGGGALTLLAWGLMGGLFAAWSAMVFVRFVTLVRTRSPAALRALDPVFLGLSAAAFVACLVAVRFHWLAFFPLVHLLRGTRGWERGRLALRSAAALACALLAFALPRAGDFAAFASEVAREPEGYRAPWLDARYCGRASRFLQSAGLTGRLYNPFNLGGSLGYWLAPGLRTFIDGRLDHAPPVVLDDYLAIRRASRVGPTDRLRAMLERWQIDVFVADTFAAGEYPNRHSGVHLRRLPEWIPIYASRNCALYLSRGPRNRANLARVAAWYGERNVPFDTQRGLDVSRVFREAPEWAREQGLEPPPWVGVAQWRAGDEVQARIATLEVLGEHWWRVGRFDAQVEIDRALVEARPREYEPRRRLVDGLLHLGRGREALAEARILSRRHRREPEAAYLLRVATEAASLPTPGVRRREPADETPTPERSIAPR